MGAVLECPTQDRAVWKRFWMAPARLCYLPAPSPRKKLPESTTIGFGQPPVIPAQRGMRARGQCLSLHPPGGPDPAHALGQLARRRRSDPPALLRFH